MKPNNTGEDMWLRAETANEKFKQDERTQDADAKHTPVLCMTQLEATSQQ